jgi:hypothetical protein
MKTEKELLFELVDKFENIAYSILSDISVGIDVYVLAKECAKIAIDERIETIRQYADEEVITAAIIHQMNIKKEIEKL